MMVLRAHAAILLLLAPSPALALPSFLGRIPNGDNPRLLRGQACGVCHLRPQGDGDRNDFGWDWENASSGGWSALYLLDSDGDGQTNGYELGDPSGRWRPGQTAERTDNLSNPGDPASRVQTSSPDAGAPDVTGGADAERGSDAGASRPDLGDGPARPGDGGPEDTGERRAPEDAGPRQLPRLPGGEDSGPRGTSEEGWGCRCGRSTRRPPHLWILLGGLGLAMLRPRSARGRGRPGTCI